MDYRSLKIIHINATDCGGGAAIACSRHCEAMIEEIYPKVRYKGSI